MELVYRQIHLINALMEEPDFKPVKYYADKFNVSPRTIHSDLKKIEPYMKKILGITIEKKAGVGIKVNSSNKKENINKIALLNKDDATKRKLKILEMLLFEGKTVTMQQLSEQFYISKSSISNDLSIIKNEFLNDSTAQLVSDQHGTRLEGTEEQFQNTFVRFNTIFGNQGMVSIAEKERESFLYKYYGEKLVKVCFRIFKEYQEQKLDHIADHYIENIQDILVILAFRASQGYHIEGSGRTGILSNSILDKISSELHIEFTNGDTYYLMKHLVANKMKSREFDMEIEHITDQILIKLSETLKYNFTNDEQLRNQLLAHIPYMIFRLKNGISIHNPLLSQIKEEFGLMYNITWFILSEFEETLEVRFTENEIGFVMIYFQSALDRVQVGKKILIVCPTGITMSGLLRNRVEKILPPFDSIEVSSFAELENVDLSKIDFIISTAHIKVEGPPVIVVSPLLTSEEMNKISTFYNQHFVLKKGSCTENSEINHNLKRLKRYMDKDFLEFNSNYQSAEEMIDSVLDRLYSEGFIYKEYKDSLLERMRVGDTALPSGVAIPHGMPKYVRKTVLAICVNETPIKWDDQNVRVVIFLCISNEDLKHVREILSPIYRLVENKANVEDVFLNKCKDEFILLMEGIKID